jgi:hypothetical protein
MKKFLLLFSMLFLFFVKGQSQVYYSFPDSSASWNIEVKAYCWGGIPGPLYNAYSITFSKDTVISNVTYHKLTIPFLQYFSGASCALDNTKLNVYKGAIRQDTTAKKVFFVPPYGNTEQLLYDFTMQLGDTIRGYLGSFAFQKQIVQSIDSVWVGNTYRKRWNIDTNYDVHIIEGIGSTYGVIEPLPGNTVDQPERSIICFRQNAQTIFPNPNNCELITSINSADKILNQVKIFPNPSNGTFTIDFDKANIKEIVLTDLLGKVILKQVLNGQSDFKINPLKSGVYILTLINTENKKVNKKLISSQ